MPTSDAKPPAEVEAAFRSSEVLNLLSEPSLRRFIGAGALVELKPGALLFQAGDPGDAVYVVLTGEVEVHNVTTGGRDLRHTALGPGCLVGEMAPLDGEPRSADVTASRRTRLWRVPSRALIEVLKSDPGAAIALVVELSRRLRASNAALQAATSLDLAGRLAQLLIAEKGPHDRVAMTQTEMARRIGASRERVNRRLHAWCDAGWVETDSAGVRLLDIGRLKALFQG